MPRGDGSGSLGQGFGSGRGQGGRQTASGARMGGVGLGAGGNCVCSKCGKRIPHQRGIPCSQQACPECGSNMTREA